MVLACNRIDVILRMVMEVVCFVEYIAFFEGFYTLPIRPRMFLKSKINFVFVNNIKYLSLQQPPKYFS